MSIFENLFRFVTDYGKGDFTIYTKNK